MQLSEDAFVAIVYGLLIWFIGSNLLLAAYSVKEWISSALKRSRP